MNSLSNQVKGTVISIVGVLTLTPDTLFIRLAEDVDPLNVQFYRYGLSGLTLLFVFILRERRHTIEKFKEIGKVGVLASISWGAANFFFTTAVQQTAVANVLVINASNPMFSAILGTELGSDSNNLVGMICALLSSVLMGLYFVLLRVASKYEGCEPDMMPCNVIAGLLVAFLVLAMGANPAEVTQQQSLVLCLQGMVEIPISFSLLTIGPSLITAAEVSLYFLIETVLGPVWVYLAGYEAPPTFTVYGGAILIVALFFHSVAALRETSRIPVDDKEKCEDESDDEGHTIEVVAVGYNPTCKRENDESNNGLEEELKKEEVDDIMVVLSSNRDGDHNQLQI
eukprot:gene30914-40234_t